MYVKVGHLPDSRKLVELVAQFKPVPSQQGYATVHGVEQVFQPHLDCTVKRAFIAIIWSHGSIYPHCDSETDNRKHVVLQNNEDCWYMHDNQWQKLEEGGIYTMNPRLVHASINWGPEPRVHLIYDEK